MTLWAVIDLNLWMFLFQLTTSVGFLLDSMFDFAERFNKLGLNDDEIALFSAVVLLSPGNQILISIAFWRKKSRS